MLTLEEKVGVQLDELVESFGKKLWTRCTPPGMPIALCIGVAVVAVFVLFLIVIPFMNLTEEMFSTPHPSKSVLKAFGTGLAGYLVFLVATLVQHRIETGKAAATFNLRFPSGGHARVIALQLLAVKPDRGAKRLLAALGGMAQVVASVAGEESDGTGQKGPVFQPIPIHHDSAPADQPATFSPTSPPSSTRGYIPLEPERPVPEGSDGEHRQGR
jgi:hypothetical protein